MLQWLSDGRVSPPDYTVVMTTHLWLLLLHVLGASVWTGGHLILASVVLPRALSMKDIDELQRFEASFERIGIPALLVQVTTGLWLASDFLPETQWLSFELPMARLVLLKLGLLALTVGLAADARLRVIPNLTPERLSSLAFHIIPVTVVSVLFVAAGVLVRAGGL
jgi:putative copper export protein